MPNTITKLTARIEEYATDTKTPCALYKTEAYATKRAVAAAQFAAKIHVQDETFTEADYLVFWVESLERWTFAVNTNALQLQPGYIGGYIAAVATKFNCFCY